MARPKSGNTPGYNDLKAEIRQDRCRPVYVLTGEETFLIDKLIDSLTESLVAPGSQSLDRVVLQGGGQPGRIRPEQLQAEIMTPPFLSRRKLVIVRQSGWLAPAQGRAGASVRDSGTERDDPSDSDDDPADSAVSQKGRQAFLMQLLDKIPDSACLVMVEQKVDKRQKLLIQAIEKAGVLAEFGREQPATLKKWIEAECRRRMITIDSLAAESLIDRCDGSMQVIWQELAKLFLYCTRTQTSQVGPDLIEAISLPDLRGTIFDLTDALSAGQPGRALSLADTLISQKQPVQLIQFMLARHLRQLIVAAELKRPDAIMGALKVQPFVAGRLASQASRLDPEFLERLYARFQETDMRVKSGLINDRLGLECLLAECAADLQQARRR